MSQNSSVLNVLKHQICKQNTNMATLKLLCILGALEGKVSLFEEIQLKVFLFAK